ncbi:MAG: phage scaffolding protein [Clostridium sp.]
MNKQQFIALGLTEDLATKAEAESKKELETYIPKTRFDEVNNSKKDLEATITERDKQLEDLKKVDGEALKKQIETLQADNKAKDIKYQVQLKDLQVSNAIKMAIADKAMDTDLVAGLFDKSKLILNDDGKITGLDEQVKTLKESKAFLFKQEEILPTSPHILPGFKVGTDGDGKPNNTGTMSMKEAIAAQIQSKNLK